MNTTATTPTALHVIDLPIAGECYVDFKLKELRKVSLPSMAVPFSLLMNETKAIVRGIRAEFGPNEYIEGLDD